MKGPPLGGGGGVQMEQFPPVPPTQPETEPASPSNSTVAGVWEEGGGWESGMGNNDIINYPQALPASPLFLS